MPPKIPLLEKIGIFDGTKKEELYQNDIDTIQKNNPNIIKKIKEKKDDKQVVILDAYLYREYKNSLISQTFTQKEVEKAQETKSIIEQTPLPNNLYKVKVNMFLYTFNKNPNKTYFYFVTTEEGNDLFTELWKGSRVSLSLALIVSLSTLFIGVCIGSLCGYYGGIIDLIINSFVQYLSLLPFISLMIVFMLKIGFSFWNIALVFLIKGWISSFYYTRSQFYRYKNKEYVVSARMLGASDFRIMFKHIFPNIIGLMVTSFALSIPSFILVESVYSFTGIIKYPEGISSIGELLDKSFSKIHSFSYLLIFPISYLIILMFAFNILGNNLRESFEPKDNS
ncbi:ABC transporter permease ['Camptotheca acuminata' phytoplasma]|uniref:ABC transporter permease n=1 Tax='Camptotheca acuminata' phytoplasma TaxID=3239192 RepID=UPI00351A7D07